MSVNPNQDDQLGYDEPDISMASAVNEYESDSYNDNYDNDYDTDDVSDSNSESSAVPLQVKCNYHPAINGKLCVHTRTYYQLISHCY